MIFLTGDLHGGVTAHHISPAKFRPTKRGDIVICLGDFGGVWYHDYHCNKKSKRSEDYFLETTLRQRVIWLTVDGNHENFAHLFGGEFPLVKIFSGKAYRIRKNIFYLKRGELFTIEGRTFLAFGGASSHDKDPGWYDPPLSHTVMVAGNGIQVEKREKPCGPRRFPAGKTSKTPAGTWTGSYGKWIMSCRIPARSA